ncbi:molybdenum cofactor cytidylyltransferase [Luteibacter jiangsuensis]|uniref:Molybdenum cofactor cytidylyltransferase n=1 Tax=Luteibacter jiangsuensis TaxID=637577 RepID=A0ABT9T299_9GAMM|nr:nucleotidyltransferase family protein [Luteibacter jiangsuensis]MDQ0011399.1 molybdenum cofactor cytidylyltransferase [Luteibacter jiangsuensis]
MAHDAVVLAAGGSRRLGRPKQLLTVGGEPLVARVARLALGTRPSRTLVIVGAYQDVVTAALAPCDVEIIVNPAWTTGMASSLHLAARVLHDRDLPVLLSVVDQPALVASHFDALLAAHDDSRDTVSAYGEALGIPAVLRASTLTRARVLAGDMGFRHLWAQVPPHAVRADELGEDLDDEAAVARATAAGLLDDPQR